MIIAYLISYPQFYIWNISYIISHSFLTGSLEPTNDELPTSVGFVAQLVRASHWCRDVTGSNPVEVLTFSGFYIRNCINCIHNCKDHNLRDFTSAVQYMKHFINHLTLIPHGLIRTNKWPAPNVSGLIAQAPVVQMVDNAIHRINHYPLDIAIGFAITYPVDSAIHRLNNWGQLVRGSHRYREVTGSNPVEVLSFSGFRVRNCINCVRNCKDHNLPDFTSAVHYMKHFINHLTFIPHGLIRTNKWPAPNVSGFIAQLVRASHRYREVTGWNPVEVLTFSLLLYTQLHKLHS